MCGLFAGSVYGYGPVGHKLVGAIADNRLATNPTVKAKVKVLLGGLTLARAATLPDEIKNKKPNQFSLRGQPKITAQLRAFMKANSGGKPSHSSFHFTDVPVFGNERYADGTVGRRKFDIVQMIPLCIRVLKGDEPEKNDFAITKTVAVILLAHYMGDIHQPLHVGAEYFNSGGQPFEPTESDRGFADQGGNKLDLFLLSNGKSVPAGNLHGFWDTPSVTAAFGTNPGATVARRLAESQPPNLNLNGGTETWAEQMANEIMPIAREAHTRLTFSQIKANPGAEEINKGGDATETPTTGSSYKSFAAATVSNEIQKAGWRLAAILEDALK
jgi:hypothetical protein